MRNLKKIEIIPPQAWLRYGNAALLLAVLVVNWLAERLPLGVRTTGEVSDLYPVLITPAGYAFGIWGLIYSLLAAFAIVGLLPSRRKEPELIFIGPWFIASCLFNITWVYLWHSLYITSSVFAMLALLLTLAIVYHRTRTPSGHRKPDVIIRWFVQLPFSLYLGWITVATLVNGTVGLSAAGWEGWGIPAAGWAMLLLGLAGLLAFLVGRRYRDPVYVLTVLWGLVAIGVKQQQVDIKITYTAWSISAALLFYAFRLFRLRLRSVE